MGGGARSFPRRRVANVCVAPALFTKPTHVYRLRFDSLSHLTSLQKGRVVIVLLFPPISKFRSVNIPRLPTRSQALLCAEGI